MRQKKSSSKNLISKGLEKWLAIKPSGRRELRPETYKEVIGYLKGSLDEQDGLPDEVRVVHFCILADCYRKIGNYKESLTFLHKAIVNSECSKRCSVMVFDLMNVTLGLDESGDRLSKSILSIEQNFQKKGDPASQAIVAVTKCLTGDFSRMEKSLVNALELNPRHPYLVYLLARCKSGKREYEDALGLYEKLHSLRPELTLSFDYLWNRGRSYYFSALNRWREGDITSAETFLLRGIEFAKDRKTTLENTQGVQKHFAPFVDVTLKRELTLFHEVVSLDRVLEKLFKSATLFQVGLYAGDAVYFVEHSSVLLKVIESKERSLFQFPLVQIVGHIKAFCAAVVQEAIRGLFPENLKKRALEIDPAEFDGCRKVLMGVGFMRAKQALDGVETFASALIRLRGLGLKKAEHEEDELLRLLKPAYVLSDELSQFMAEKEFQEGKVKPLRDMIQQELERGMFSIKEGVKQELEVAKRKLASSAPAKARQEIVKETAGKIKAVPKYYPYKKDRFRADYKVRIQCQPSRDALIVINDALNGAVKLDPRQTEMCVLMADKLITDAGKKSESIGYVSIEEFKQGVGAWTSATYGTANNQVATQVMRIRDKLEKNGYERDLIESMKGAGERTIATTPEGRDVIGLRTGYRISTQPKNVKVSGVEYVRDRLTRTLNSKLGGHVP